MSEQQQLIPISPGESLRQRRVKKKLSIADISNALRIDGPVVVSIESDQLDHLAPIYRRGYVQSYARHLGFKKDEIAQMLAAIDDQAPQLHTVFPEASRPDQSDRWIKAAGYVLASLLVGTLAWQFSHEAIRLSGEVSESAELGSGTVGLNSANNGESSKRHVNASIAALENIKRPSGRGSAAEQAWAALDQVNADSADGIEGESVLKLSASGDSWVEITDAQGRQLELDLVRGGSSKQYRGEAPFSIQLGRASAISLLINGQAVDLAPHTQDDVTQMLLDKPGDEASG
ncbi:MAG: helix-turn-helix domain-containing protein [Xanthomonadales bacterium]|nr:helix-turn-helix domain-containing protein [Xanthomonadales bacterium]NNL96127.1 helix-turn-helix domain-containing protein [Xanthomonadales bacterium]